MWNFGSLHFLFYLMQAPYKIIKIILSNNIFSGVLALVVMVMDSWFSWFIPFEKNFV